MEAESLKNTILHEIQEIENAETLALIQDIILNLTSQTTITIPEPVKSAIRAGINDIEAGRTHTEAQVDSKTDEWFKN